MAPGDKAKYRILKETFCIYCQQDFKTPKKLQGHVHKKHAGTYAYNAIREALGDHGKGQE